MKVALSITLSLVVGAAATGFVLLNQKHSHEEAQQQLGKKHAAALEQERKKADKLLQDEKEKAQIQSERQMNRKVVEAKTAREVVGRKSRISTLTSQITKLEIDNQRLTRQRDAVAAKEQMARVKAINSPEDIILELPELYTSNESAFQRRRIHLTESLVDMGSDSLPAIRKFLAAGIDTEPDIDADVRRRLLDRYGITDGQYVKIQTSISDTLKQKEREARGFIEVEKLRAAVEANAKVVLGAEKFEAMQNDRSLGRLISEIGGSEYREAVGGGSRGDWGRGRGGDQGRSRGGR